MIHGHGRGGKCAAVIVGRISARVHRRVGRRGPPAATARAGTRRWGRRGRLSRHAALVAHASAWPRCRTGFCGRRRLPRHERRTPVRLPLADGAGDTSHGRRSGSQRGTRGIAARPKSRATGSRPRKATNGGRRWASRPARRTRGPINTTCARPEESHGWRRLKGTTIVVAATRATGSPGAAGTREAGSWRSTGCAPLRETTLSGVRGASAPGPASRGASSSVSEACSGQPAPVQPTSVSRGVW